MAEPDPRNSLRHVLAVDPIPDNHNDDDLTMEPENQNVKRDDSSQPLDDLEEY